MASVPQPRNNQVMRLGNRDFCRFGVENNISCVPVDSDEDVLFEGFHDFLSSSYLPTVPPAFDPPESPKILDCGYGTGTWLDDVMGEYDNSETFGIDIFERYRAGVQEFESIMWNLNDPFIRAPRETWNKLKRETLDLINSRFLTDGIDDKRWEPLIREYKEWLKPGGWLQMAEIQWTFRSQSGQELPNLGRWSEAYSAALIDMQKNPDITTVKNPDVMAHLEKLVRWRGFELVNSQVHDILLPDWRPEGEDGDDEDSASAAMRYVHGILESFAWIPFTRQLKWSPEKAMQVVRAAQTELRIPDAQISFKLEAPQCMADDPGNNEAELVVTSAVKVRASDLKGGPQLLAAFLVEG